MSPVGRNEQQLKTWIEIMKTIINLLGLLALAMLLVISSGCSSMIVQHSVHQRGPGGSSDDMTMQSGKSTFGFERELQTNCVLTTNASGTFEDRSTAYKSSFRVPILSDLCTGLWNFLFCMPVRMSSGPCGGPVIYEQPITVYPCNPYGSPMINAYGYCR